MVIKDLVAGARETEQELWHTLCSLLHLLLALLSLVPSILPDIVPGILKSVMDRSSGTEQPQVHCPFN